MKVLPFIFLLACIYLLFVAPQLTENYGLYGEPDSWTQELIESKDPTKLDMLHLSRLYLSDCDTRIKLPVVKQQTNICSDKRDYGLLNDVCR